MGSSDSQASFDGLPLERSWGGREFVQQEGFWFPKRFFPGVKAARTHFKARDEDIILASPMKTGCTWLKALIPCVMNHKAGAAGGDDEYDPLIHNHPNALMPSLEIQIFRQEPAAGILDMPSPRLFRTHAPYAFLSQSIKSSGCKIVYIARDPKDVFVSLWHFLNQKMASGQIEPYPLNEAFETFCAGLHPFGPFHDHVLSYWYESLKRTEKILFLKYEDMKRDPRGQVQKLASFLGRPLEKEEEVDRVLWKCSLERLKNLPVNQNGADPFVGIAYKAYFRMGMVGDWKNYLSTEMKERLDKITEMKMGGSGLEL